ncbi:MAG: hypothetical protein CSA11_05710 [Chloroflexi bacterium]|nr:MAG: hypothetical protein CSA11_05710 [Chloroflexota bacterium]
MRIFKLPVLVLLFVVLSACQFPAEMATAVPPTMVPTAIVQPNHETGQPTVVSSAVPTLVPPQTAVPLPTTAYNPNLAEWTILVYMDGDNNLELSALQDLNEMEAAGSSEQVNVVAQIDRARGETAADGDWTGARRYRIVGDAAEQVLASELLADMGELNMGDPQVLADFVAWGMQAFPANRTALVLWDHGAGWQGISFDNDTPLGADHLDLADLNGGLSAGLAKLGQSRLDVVAFDACLMGQLDVFEAVQPYARYAVASEELTPGRGWNYRSWLGQLYANPQLAGSELARLLVDDFAGTYTQIEPDDFVTMAAVDLQQLPALTYAWESLSQILLADPVFTASAVGDARSGAEAFARVYAQAFEHYGVVDLGHFASILAQRSPSAQVTAAALQVDEALQTAVLANRHGAGFKNSDGIAIYFPQSQEYYAEAYGQATPLKLWNQYLYSYHTHSFAKLPPPEIHLAPVTADSVGVQSPAYLDFEIVGRDIANVVLFAGFYGEDGTRRLVEYDNLIPEPTFLPDGSSIYEWRDGVHEDFYIWHTKVTYLYDQVGAGDFAVMWPTAPGSDLFTVSGEFQRADGTTFPANLVFDHTTDHLTRIWGAGSSAAAAEITPQLGDTFQMDTWYFDENDELYAEQGVILTFDETGSLYFDWRPLPNGRYFIGFEAENVAGGSARVATDAVVNNEEVLDGYTAYLDPYLGFQFMHPSNWYTPVYTDALLYTSSRDTDTHLQVIIYPHLEPDTNPLALKNQTLHNFGAVDLLYQDEIAVAGVGGQQVAYGYDKAGVGPRTGLFFTFVKEGKGYVVDVDGPQELEAETIAAVQQMQRSWQFTDQRFGFKPGDWAELDEEAFSVAYPLDFRYQAQGDWQRFVADGHTFVALRAQPETRPSVDVLAALVRDAGAGVDSFEAERPFPFPLAGYVWDRVNFAYTATDGTEIWGAIMTRIDDGQEIVAWAEAPATTYNDLEATIFLTLIADLRNEN